MKVYLNLSLSEGGLKVKGFGETFREHSSWAFLFYLNVRFTLQIPSVFWICMSALFLMFILGLISEFSFRIEVMWCDSRECTALITQISVLQSNREIAVECQGIRTKWITRTNIQNPFCCSLVSCWLCSSDRHVQLKELILWGARWWFICFMSVHNQVFNFTPDWKWPAHGTAYSTVWAALLYRNASN